MKVIHGILNNDIPATKLETTIEEALEREALKVFLKDVAEADYSDLYTEFSYDDNQRIIFQAETSVSALAIS